ncbi:sensor histidine kinase [Leucobacter chromiireducens]|uniref:histidine kinase n=1 Tax=Leucobacter chromiireducens subsp. chromiireducens TaxID=660067 RepID=A0ABS1SQW0_9MICO|nr:histidine kinase [Leucobacter chromiireducens]MBL3690340.1 sensor histidine kinase [Leucobacter chromiireducens subsp. chromiireducens]
MTARRSPWLWGAATLLAVALLAVSAALGVTVYGMPVVESLMIAATQSAGLLIALRFPRWGLAVLTIAVISGLTLAQPTATAPWPVQVTSLLALLATYVLVALHGRWLAAVASAALIGITASGVASGAGNTVPGGPMVANLIVLLALSTITIGITTLVRAVRAARGELAEAREVSELELARRQIAEERTRIAREMHDVVAHGMSVIQVQAASARYRFPEIDEAVADEFDELAATARTALGEMRALLGVLRADDGAEHAPQPGLGDLPELVARSRATLTDQLPGSLAARMDPVCQLAVYRVVQESLGNAARHAAGASATVSLAPEPPAPAVPAGVRVIVQNGAPPADRTVRAAPDPSGHGIRGMRERVTALGGALSADPSPGGGFQVTALLPIVPGTQLTLRHPVSPEEPSA